MKVTEIRRPLARTRSNNAAKVEALMESIEQHGLKEPIDVLEVKAVMSVADSSCHLLACGSMDRHDVSHCRWMASCMASAVRWDVNVVHNGACSFVQELSGISTVSVAAGCHRFEAFQRLGKETIPCRVRKATQKTLQMHLM